MPSPNRDTDSVDKPGRTAILRAFSDGAPAALIARAQVAELVDALASGASGH